MDYKLTLLILFILAIGIYLFIYFFKLEKFGNLTDNTIIRTDLDMSYMGQQPTGMDILNPNYIYEKNQNYNTLNDLPYLINPNDPSKGYYYNRIKLENNPNSELLLKENMTKVNNILDTHIEPIKKPNEIGYRGYNNYVELDENNYSPVTSIGKSLLTPFIYYPLPL